jgi:DNA-binding transcriptional ArsR family regulator
MCPGTDAGRDRSLDRDLAKALSHPLRQRILERLGELVDASPTQLARDLDASTSTVAYHVRVLERLGCVELVGTRQRRGALEHRYRALVNPWLDAEQWAGLSPGLRRHALARELRKVMSDAAAAGAAGGFDPPDAQIRRLTLTLDEDGWSEVARVLDRTVAALQQLQSEHGRRPEEAPIDAQVAVLLFRRTA